MQAEWGQILQVFLQVINSKLESDSDPDQFHYYKLFHEISYLYIQGTVYFLTGAYW